MTDEKLNEAYYQPGHLWTDGKAVRQLHTITSVPKKDVKPWLAKQTIRQVHIPRPKEINHPYCDVTKPNEQLYMSSLTCFIYPIIYLKETQMRLN